MGHKEVKSFAHHHTASKYGAKIWTWAGLYSQPLSCPITFFYTSLFSRRKRTQQSTRQSFYRKKNPCSAQRLSEPTEYEQVTPETETGIGLRSPVLTRTKTDGNTWLKHKLQRLSKAGSLSKRQKADPPQISSNLSKRRQIFQDEDISGKFLDLTSNYLRAISPTDVTEPESVSAAGKICQKYFRYLKMTP